MKVKVNRGYVKSALFWLAGISLLGVVAGLIAAWLKIPAEVGGLFGFIAGMVYTFCFVIFADDRGWI